MSEFSESLISLRDLTLEAIGFLQKNEIEEFEKTIILRGRVIGEIMKSEYSTGEFRELSRKLKIEELDNELLLLAEQRKSSLKKEMGKLNRSKMAHGAYNKSFTNNSYFVKRKV